MREFSRKFYLSTAWKKCRKSYRDSVFGLCERCSAKGFVVAGKIVHHKIWLNQNNINDPNVTLNHEHLELLCHDCHNKEHMERLPVADGLMFDKFGNVISAHDTPHFD